MFCHKCGKEVADDAYICVGCGCVVGYTAKKSIQENVEKSGTSSWCRVASICLFAFYLCFALFIVSFGIGVTDLRVYVRYVYLDDIYLICMLASSVFSYLSSIFALVFGIKSKDINTRNSCVISFILANAILAVSLFAMLF